MRDDYTSENVFWVPETAHWEHLQANAKQPEVGVLLDAAIDAIEKENPTLQGVLPKAYAREDIDKRLLSELVDLIGNIGLTETDDHDADDVLGRVYEYLLGRFAAAARCSNLTRAACTAPAAAPAACSCSRTSSSRPTVVSVRT